MTSSMILDRARGCSLTCVPANSCGKSAKALRCAGARPDSRGGPPEGRAWAPGAAQRPRDHARRLAGVPAHLLQGALACSDQDNLHKPACWSACVICGSVCWRSFDLTEVRRRCHARRAPRLQGDMAALNTFTSYRRARQTPARSATPVCRTSLAHIQKQAGMDHAVCQRCMQSTAG